MPGVTIDISAERLEHYCAGARRTARSPAQALAALTAVETFLAATAGPAEQETTAYREAVAVLRSHIEACREALLEESAAALSRAIERQAPDALAPLHGALSRSGFQQALERAAERLSPQVLDHAWLWARTWCTEAERRALEASGYPDAYDFAAAGIRVETHAAMKDLTIFLGGRVT